MLSKAEMFLPKESSAEPCPSLSISAMRTCHRDGGTKHNLQDPCFSHRLEDSNVKATISASKQSCSQDVERTLQNDGGM